MATAVGAYAVWTNVKTRLGQSGQQFGTFDDTEGPLICAQVNGWIEAKTGRPLCPYPLVATTITAGGGAGSSAVTLAAVTNINIGDSLLFGAVSAAHESATVIGVSGSVVTLQTALLATYANGTAVQKPYLWDIEEAHENGKMIEVPNGIVYATDLEVAFYTGGAFNLIPRSDWFLRPTPLEREPGWPATEIWMTDIPSSNNAAPVFSRGFQVVRLTGCQPGWPAIPDEITGFAEKMVVGLYRAKASGGGGTITVGTDGSRMIERLMSSDDWKLINRYSGAEVVLV